MVNCTIDTMIEGLNMIAQLLSSEDKTVSLMVRKSSTMSIIRRYCEHCLSDVRTLCFWAISNIAGSEEWAAVF